MALRAEDLTLTSPEMGETAEIMPLHPHHEGVFISETQIVRGSIKVGDSQVDWAAEIPDNPAYDGVWQFASGFGANMQSSEAFQHAAARAGNMTVVYGPARRDHARFWQRAQNPQKLHVMTLEAIADSLADNEEIKAKAPDINVNKKLMVSHSMGGLAIAGYAKENPKKVDALFNLAAVGYGQPTMGSLLRHVPAGLVASLWHELLPALQDGHIAATPKNAVNELRYFIEDLSRPFLEGASCLRQDVRPTVKKLGQTGISSFYLAFAHDILVPADPSIAKHVDVHRTLPRAGHLAPQCKPEAVVAEMTDMLAA